MVPLLTITDNDCDSTFEALFNDAEPNHDPEVRYDIGGGGGGETGYQGTCIYLMGRLDGPRGLVREGDVPPPSRKLRHKLTLVCPKDAILIKFQ